jgi:16S rRNA (cytidine1402-2'-O)-methyltransferase
MVAPPYAGAAESGQATGRLVVIGTPIGNLDDLSPRAAAALRGADLVACEDTRRTATLLRHAGSTADMLPAHAHNEASRAADIRGRIAAGAVVALVTDAGVPAISDPGGRVVDAILEADLPIEVVPGPSALTAAYSVAGEVDAPIAFIGFFPRKRAERMALFERIDAASMAIVGFESARRLPTLLEDLAVHDPTRRSTVARELTKRHEEIVRGTARQLADRFASVPKGEVTLVIGPVEDAGRSAADVAAAVDVLLSAGLRPSAAADVAAKLDLAPRNAAYEAALARTRRANT